LRTSTQPPTTQGDRERGAMVLITVMGGPVPARPLSGRRCPTPTHVPFQDADTSAAANVGRCRRASRSATPTDPVAAGSRRNALHVSPPGVDQLLRPAPLLPRPAAEAAPTRFVHRRATRVVARRVAAAPVLHARRARRLQFATLEPLGADEQGVTVDFDQPVDTLSRPASPPPLRGRRREHPLHAVLTVGSLVDSPRSRASATASATPRPASAR
jgi:hypothetical protein